eukprot:TRINITY_DN20772_c0_g1_i1.p1 TRINITY_DN20772_c0_g1~~TRINITY_DN20772_c0_g1_i1.p1  ORF type:complete len:646 (+),score=24.88 TRINITY_DN20772_c0_g1_i1:90-2027(+)
MQVVRVCVCLMVIVVAARAEQFLVYLSSSGVYRLKADGTSAQQLISWSSWNGCTDIRGVAVSTNGLMLFSCDRQVMRADLTAQTPQAAALTGLSSTSQLLKDGLCFRNGVPLVAAHDSNRGGYIVDEFDPTPPGADGANYLKKKAGFPDGGGLATVGGDVWLSWADGKKGSGLCKSNGASGDTNLQAVTDYWTASSLADTGTQISALAAGSDQKLYFAAITTGSSTALRVDTTGGAVEVLSGVSLPALRTFGVPAFNANGQPQPAFVVVGSPPVFVYAEGATLKSQSADGSGTATVLYTAAHDIGPLAFYESPSTPAPQTDAPVTTAPDTPAPDTPQPPAGSSPAPDTPAPPTQAPDTPAPPLPPGSSLAPETPAPETPQPQAGNTTAPPANATNATESPTADANSTGNATAPPDGTDNSTNTTTPAPATEDSGLATWVLIVAGVALLCLVAGIIAYCCTRDGDQRPEAAHDDQRMLGQLSESDVNMVAEPALLPAAPLQLIADSDVDLHLHKERCPSQASEVLSPRAASFGRSQPLTPSSQPMQTSSAQMSIGSSPTPARAASFGRAKRPGSVPPHVRPISLSSQTQSASLPPRALVPAGRGVQSARAVASPTGRGSSAYKPETPVSLSARGLRPSPVRASGHI